MMKKIRIPIAIIISVFILLVPVPSGQYKDGGTKEYTALTYKVVQWRRLTGSEGYARCEKGQADLTNEQLQKVKEIIARAEEEYKKSAE